MGHYIQCMKYGLKSLVLAIALLMTLGISGDHASVSSCPVSNTTNLKIIEDFLTKPHWSEERAATGTSGLAISKISLLTNSTYSTTCTSLNAIYTEALQELNGLGEKAYNVTYFTAGGKFFVLITLRQSTTVGYVTTGLGFIDVYNSNLSLIKGYAF